MKTVAQLKKERERRGKLRNCVLNHPKAWTLNQTTLARVLGCSQSTVSRDLKKLASSRWNPFRQIVLTMEKERREKEEKWLDALEQRDEALPIEDRIEQVSRLLSLTSGRRLYPKNSRPRGKSFTNSYQPRLGQWGMWPFHCPNCGYEGEVEITGAWSRGQKVFFKCLVCGKELNLIRPELPVERCGFTAPCGYAVEISAKGRWDGHPLSFDCPKCGKEHIIEKRFTRTIN